MAMSGFMSLPYSRNGRTKSVSHWPIWSYESIHSDSNKYSNFLTMTTVNHSLYLTLFQVHFGLIRNSEFFMSLKNIYETVLIYCKLDENLFVIYMQFNFSFLPSILTFLHSVSTFVTVGMLKFLQCML